MTEPGASGLTLEALRKAAEANVRYYQAWGRLARQWFDEVSAVSRQAMAANTPTSTPTAPAATAGPAEATAQSAPPGAALVLEAAAGNEATGAFLVENHLGHPVDAAVLADPVDGVEGLTVQFDPPTVGLAPHETAVVKVSVVIPDAMPVGVEHRTTLRVPDLPGSSISVVLRRTDAT